MMMAYQIQMLCAQVSVSLAVGCVALSRRLVATVDMFLLCTHAEVD